MSKLIMNEKPLHLLPTLAMKVGFKEALILQYLRDCLENDSHRLTVNGKVWVRRTYEDWQKNLPFWSVETIKRIISSLEEKEYLLSSKIRESQFDHGKWYTINDPQLEDIKVTPSYEEEDKYKEILINSDKHPLWMMACESLFKQTKDLTTKKWLCEMDIMALTGGSVHLSVPNQLIKNWVITTYYTSLVKSLEDALGYPIEKLHINTQTLPTFGGTPSPETEEEGKTSPTSLSSSTPYSTNNSSQSTGVSS